MISVPDLSAMLLAPAVYCECRPDLPENEDSLSNSDLRAAKSTVVSPTDLNNMVNDNYDIFHFLYLRSYSVPDFDVLNDFVDFELTDLPLMEPGVCNTRTKTSHL